MRKWMKSNDILLKTLSLLVALLLWFYVMDEQNPDSEKTFYGLEVQMRNLSDLNEAGLVIIEGNNPTVDIKVRGKRSDMTGLKKNSITVAVDLSSVNVPGQYNLNYTVSLENTGLNYTRITNTVPITVDRMTTKSVPVQLELNGQLADGYVQSGYSLSPGAVIVEGPERVLAQIDHAAVVYDLADASASINTSLDYTLVDEDGKEIDMTFITLQQPTLDFQMQVHQSGEIPLTVDIVPYNFITADMIDCDIKPSTIKISGEPELISSINQINLGSIGVKQLLEDNITELTLPIILPNGVTTDSEETYARVTITFKGLRQTLLTVPSAQFADIAPYSYKESELNLIFMGTDEELLALSAEDLTITPVYNAADLSVGENVVPISVSATGRQVVLLGQYTVTIIVEEDSPPEPNPNPDPNAPEE